MSTSSTQGVIKISYTINPPSSSSVTATPDLHKTKTNEYPVSPTEIPQGEDKAGRAYYAQLRKALGTARLDLGRDLTRWRDLVGKAELNKEPKVEDVDENGEQEEEES
jgi:hypothetical protein